MSLLRNNLFIFLLGATLYYCLEVLWRGYSHISMFFVGGICFTILYKLSYSGLPISFKALIGCASITLIELTCGIILNKVMHLNVWDYSRVPYNLFGQICLPYSIIWYALSFFVIYFFEKIIYHYR